MNLALPFQPARPWRTHPRETIARWALGVAALLALAGRQRRDAACSPCAEASADAGAPRRRCRSRCPTRFATSRPTDALAGQRRDPAGQRPQSGRPALLVRQGVSATARARALECLTSAIYYEAGAGKRPRASARSPRSSSTGSATRLSRTASAASSMKARPAPPAASSPSPATARWPARRCPALWNRARKVAEAMLERPRLRAGRPRHPLSRQLRRALLGLEPGQDAASRARTSSTAGPAAGAARQRSATAGRAVRRSPAALRLAALERAAHRSRR